MVRKTYIHYSYLKNKSVLDKNKELKNKHQGKRCFIIGNGPSINRQDLTKLNNEHVFVCNHFYLHKDLNIIKPSFYSLIEPIILNDRFRKKSFPRTIAMINSYASFNSDATFLFNIQYKKYIENNNLFLKNKVYYFLSGGSVSNKMNLDMSRPSPSMKGSIFFPLATAIYLGFNPIYMIGFDHDYISQKDEKHFYQPDSGLLQRKKSLLELAEAFYRDLKHLNIFNKYFQKKGIRVFNAGIGGMIDTFPRVNYDSLFYL